MTGSRYAQEQMTPDEDAPPQTIIHLVPHTHWDREWYRPFQSFRMSSTASLSISSRTAAEGHASP